MFVWVEHRREAVCGGVQTGMPFLAILLARKTGMVAAQLWSPDRLGKDKPTATTTGSDGGKVAACVLRGFHRMPRYDDSLSGDMT